MNRRSVQPVDLALEGSTGASTVNWNHLRQFRGPDAPKLLWLSVPSLSARKEEDRTTLPSVALIRQRREWNTAPREDEPLLGCKAFWEAFQRSRLVIIFDRYLHDNLLKRLREEFEPGRRLSLEAMIMFAGKERKKECAPLVKDIQTRLEKMKVKFHYLPDMMSTSAPFPHDRFAVTDGEFWHFGGSNLGLEQTLTAVSRGWKAHEMNVKSFVEEAWAANDQQRSTTP